MRRATDAVRPTEMHPLAEILAMSRGQFAIRALFCVLIAATVVILTGRIGVAVGWFVAFTAVLAFSDSLLLQQIKRRLGGRLVRASPFFFSALNTAVFGAVTPLLWWEGGVYGAVCAAIMLSGAALNLLTINHRHSPTAMAGMAPIALYFLALPAMTLAQAGLGPALAVSVMVLGFGANGAALWKLWTEMVASDRAIRAELDARRLDAEAATQAKSAFVAMVSHELRTPISGVLAAAGELQRAAQDPRQAECAAIVVESGHFMQTLLNDLLDLAKIEAGRMTVEDVVFDLGLFTHEVSRFWTLEAARRGVPLRLESAFGLPGRVVGDPTRLRQVLNNLLSNALKFTGPDGVAWSVDVGLLGGGQGELTVRVTDSGAGISPERLARLFTPYDQTDVTVARTHGGTGLGLSISRQLARLMGGELTVESPLGQGATFVLQVRLGATSKVSATASPPVAALSTSSVARPLRVLAVDDHEINRRTLSLLLQPLGAEVVTATDGAEALERASAESFDLILMDVMMPTLDGRAATRRLRAEPGSNRHTPVIGVTGGDTADELAACRTAGMTVCIAKPLSAEALYAAVELCLGEDVAVAEPVSLSA